MKPLKSLIFILLGTALLAFSFTSALAGPQADDQLRTPAEGTAERKAILAAVTDLYKEGEDHPAKFKVNYLKVHNGWAWIDVTPLSARGTPVGEPAPLLFHNDKGKWTSQELNDVGMEGEGHEGPHDPSAKYLEALQKKYPGIPADILPGGSHSDDPVAGIREHYAAINKGVKGYKTVKKELSGYSLEGGELVAYLDGPKIMKIVATHLGESGNNVEEYYYWDDKLIFVFSITSSYDRPGSGKVVRKSEDRCYFLNDRMIRWIDENGKHVASGSSEYGEKEKEYLQTSRDFVEGVRSKKATIEATP